MRIVNRIIAMSRAVRLGREFREIERAIDALNPSAMQQLGLLSLKELAQASRCEFPHLYGTPPEQRYAVWGSGTDTGLARARSDNPQVRLRGIALWLAVAFHETRDSDQAGLQAVHRQMLRVLRRLRENVRSDTHTRDEASRWTAEAVA